MDILDYLKRAKGPIITIPPFHTGHLGFVPDTEVYVYLAIPPNPGSTNCEVVVTPYESTMDNIMQFNCTMRDQPGVVNRLVDVIAERNINIASLETVSIRQFDHHRATMILNWSTAGEKYSRHIPSSQKTQLGYWDYHSIFPVNDERYVELFERIIESCSDVLVWENVAGKQLPVMNMRPIAPPALMSNIGLVAVKRHPVRKQHVQLELPPTLLKRLAASLGVDGQSLHYMLVSETTTRTLRILFPRPEIIPRVVHLGFYHSDIPRALSVILGPLARANFNILTSLLRQNKEGNNVLEAVLEYRGDGKVPFSQDEINSPQAGEQLCRWAAERIRENLLPDEVEGIEKCKLQIGLPLYPRRENSWEGRVSFGELLKQISPAVAKLQDRARPARRQPEASPVEAANSPELWLLDNIRRRRENAIPSIFLSYSRVAREHAEMVKERLKGHYRVIEYQDPDAEMIRDQVIQKIVNCDYFIGIWHPEEDSGRSISPWLFFEYGVAASNGKKTVVVHSQKLHQDVWKRIIPDIAQPEYTDLKFKSETVPLIEQICREHFVEERFAAEPLRLRRS